jgi:hypothetical protein
MSGTTEPSAENTESSYLAVRRADLMPLILPGVVIASVPMPPKPPLLVEYHSFPRSAWSNRRLIGASVPVAVQIRSPSSAAVGARVEEAGAEFLAIVNSGRHRRC